MYKDSMEKINNKRAQSIFIHLFFSFFRLVSLLSLSLDSLCILVESVVEEEKLAKDQAETYGYRSNLKLYRHRSVFNLFIYPSLIYLSLIYLSLIYISVWKERYRRPARKRKREEERERRESLSVTDLFLF